MLKKTITYTDYEGEQRTEDFYFNLSRAELVEMEMGTTGGLTKFIQRIIDAKDTKEIIAIFKELILKAYGEKSPDGRRFVKSKELSEGFAQTEAYSDLFMELSSNDESAVAFFNGIIPQGVVEVATASAPNTATAPLLSPAT